MRGIEDSVSLRIIRIAQKIWAAEKSRSDSISRKGMSAHTAVRVSCRDSNRWYHVAPGPCERILKTLGYPITDAETDASGNISSSTYCICGTVCRSLVSVFHLYIGGSGKEHTCISGCM
jgi:hypothetical protein